MKGTVGFWRANRTRRSVPAQCAFLTLWVLAVAAVLIPLAYRTSGTAGVIAAASAALVCYGSATLALLLTDRFRGPDLAVIGLLVGMFCRTGLPLVIALVIHLRTKALSEAGLPVYLLVFYLLCLAVETRLSLPDDGRTSAAKIS